MLVITRSEGEQFRIGDDIIVKVTCLWATPDGNLKARLGIRAPRELTILREEVYERTQQQRELREAAEAVVATAFGGDGGPGYDHTYGLTEGQQLEALRGACQALGDVLNPPSHIEMACGAYVEDEREAKEHSRDCRNCKDVVAEDRADMAHSDGERN
jgi:carbon storage regulator